MRTMSAKDAKNHFGELLMDAQREPVVIEKNGKPVAVVLSFEEHEEIERLKLDWLKIALAEADADVAAGRMRPLTDELVRDIKRRGRERMAAEGGQPKNAA
jgi:prevent-host-death family protein